jgi:hypothetical protein
LKKNGHMIYMNQIMKRSQIILKNNFKITNQNIKIMILKGFHHLKTEMSLNNKIKTQKY